MRHIQLFTAVAAVFLAQGAFAQSSSNGTGTGTASSTASNQGANSSSNNSSSNAFQSSNSNAVSTNSQSNGSASSLNATINIVNPVPSSGSSTNTSTLKSDSTSTTKQTLESTSTSRNEQVLSGSQSVYTEYGGSYTLKNVPSMNASPLTSSNDTCMGSASGGVAVAGFGLTAGATYTDEACKRIKMSRELWNKGMKAASLAMDCMDPAAREALEITGYTCPQTLRAQRAAEDAAQKQAALAPARAGRHSTTYPPALPPEAALAAPPGTPVPEAGPQLAMSPVLPEPAAADSQGNVVIRRVDARGEEAALRARGE